MGYNVFKVGDFLKYNDIHISHDFENYIANMYKNITQKA
jgi:hypothetical protein